MSIAAPSPATGIDTVGVPEPVLERLDELGRLIAATFESPADAPRAPANDCWLVALDGSAHSMQALAAAQRLAIDRGVQSIELVNVQPWMSKEAAQLDLGQRGWASTAPARAWLDARGFSWRLHVLMGEPAERIAEQAQSLSSLGIAMGARGLSSTEDLLLGSVVQQVLHRTHGAVLVVR